MSTRPGKHPQLAKALHELADTLRAKALEIYALAPPSPPRDDKDTAKLWEKAWRIECTMVTERILDAEIDLRKVADSGISQTRDLLEWRQTPTENKGE